MSEVVLAGRLGWFRWWWCGAEPGVLPACLPAWLPASLPIAAGTQGRLSAAAAVQLRVAEEPRATPIAGLIAAGRAPGRLVGCAATQRSRAAALSRWCSAASAWTSRCRRSASWTAASTGAARSRGCLLRCGRAAKPFLWPITFERDALAGRCARRIQHHPCHWRPTVSIALSLPGLPPGLAMLAGPTQHDSAAPDQARARSAQPAARAAAQPPTTASGTAGCASSSGPRPRTSAPSARSASPPSRASSWTRANRRMARAASCSSCPARWGAPLLRGRCARCAAAARGHGGPAGA
jgi:hypothetical protein